MGTQEQGEVEKVPPTADLRGDTAFIKNEWRRAVEAYIEIGKVLHRNKNWLDHGQFTRWIEKQLPFSPHTAQCLMRLSRNPVIAEPTRASSLPASWTTLDALARLPETVLLKAIEDGTVTARTERKHVAALQPKPDHPRPARPLKLEGRRKKADQVRITIRAGVQTLDEFLNSQVPDPGDRREWIEELGSWRAAFERLQDRLEDIEQARQESERRTDAAAPAPAA